MTRSVPTAPACLLCGEPTKLLYPSNVGNGAILEPGEVACTSPYLSVHDDIFVCRPCGLARSVPPLDSRELAKAYRDVEDPEYLVSESERRAEFRRALDAIEKRVAPASPGRLLEIGSSAGLFLDEAQQRGWDAVGIEPSRWASERATALGVRVFNGGLDEFVPTGGPFDVVASWDVWEHLEDPIRALERAFELLRPGGIFVFTTVNMGGLGAKIFRGRWPWFMRMHLHYFTRKSLDEMVRNAGFDVVAMSTQPKRLKLGYVLERARRFNAPLASIGSAAARWLRVERIPVPVNLGDILWIEAAKPHRDG